MEPVEIVPVGWEESSDLLLAVRREVFVREQGVSEEIEIDGHDPRQSHYLARLPDGTPVGSARLSDDGRVGRVAVLRQFRRHGIGRAIMDHVIQDAKSRGLTEMYLHSQLSAVEFYKALGFCEEGEIFLEADIEHVQMRMVLENP